jgi:hypothetical protein
MRLLFLFITLTGLAVGCQQPTNNAVRPTVSGHEYKSADGHYTILFPNAPEVTNKQIEHKRYGRADLCKAYLLDKRAKREYVCSHCDYKVFFTGDPYQYVVDSQKDLVGHEMTIDSAEKFIVGKYEGTDVSASNRTKKIYLRARYLLVGQRLYQLLVGGPSPELLHEEQTERFLNSFRLLEEK